MPGNPLSVYNATGLQNYIGYEEDKMRFKRIGSWFRAVVVWLGCWLVAPQGYAQEAFRLIDNFESGLGQRWERRDFRGETDYTIVAMDGGHCLMAKSTAAASGLIHRVRYDLRDYPVLSWRWKVDNVLAKGDASRKEGDDYAARIYVVFPHWIPLKTRSINYIWANQLPEGSHLPNAFYAKAVMVAVQSGPENLERWITERRDVYDDYRVLFGEAPPSVGAIALMTDTDNTGESATAYYDDIRIEKRRVVAGPRFLGLPAAARK